MTMSCGPLTISALPKNLRQWLPVPTNLTTDPANLLASVGNFEFAEIKPHNSDGISGGLEQLGLQEGRGRERLKGSASPFRTGKFLVTYLPVDEQGKSALEGNPHCVRVFVTNRCKNEVKKKDPSGRIRKWEQIINDWDWYDLGSFKPPPTIPLIVQEASVFGVVIEPYVRQVFRNKVLGPKKKIDRGGRALRGADIYWNELARFYTELARELGDPFYADLASELASLSCEAAMWDVA